MAAVPILVPTWIHRVLGQCCKQSARPHFNALAQSWMTHAQASRDVELGLDMGFNLIDTFANVAQILIDVLRGYRRWLSLYILETELDSRGYYVCLE
jgi:hypothetical protein